MDEIKFHTQEEIQKIIDEKTKNKEKKNYNPDKLIQVYKFCKGCRKTKKSLQDYYINYNENLDKLIISGKCKKCLTNIIKDKYNKEKNITPEGKNAYTRLDEALKREIESYLADGVNLKKISILMKDKITLSKIQYYKNKKYLPTRLNILLNYEKLNMPLNEEQKKYIDNHKKE
jgi:hypothetical protein